MSKVVEISESGIKFDDGWHLYSEHEGDCCESHFLQFKDLSLSDFDGLTFNLGDDLFFEGVPGYGIRLLPEQANCAVSIAGYGQNNGYYSSDLTLVLKHTDGRIRTYDIEECQAIEWD